MWNGGIAVTTECCKFCGADVWYVKDGDGAFECRTTLDYSWRSIECKVATCARYEALFPIAPWSTEPITAGVCERLGMIPDNLYYDHDDGVSAFLGNNAAIIIGEPGIITAGQLSCLIAARKGAAQ